MLKILKWKIAAMVALCVIVTVFSNIADAQEGTVVKVGWYESPFNYVDKFNRRSGYAYEYQQKIAAYTGWKYEYIWGSWPELFEKLKTGEIDMLSDVSYTPERANEMLFASLPMGAETYYLFISANDSSISVSHLATLNGKKVGVNKGSYQLKLFNEWAAANGISVQVVELTEDLQKTVKMLEAGDIDGLVMLDSYEDMDDHACVPIIKIGQSNFFFAVNKNRPDLQAELNAAMSKINDENRFYNNVLYDKFLKSSGTNAFISNDELNWLAQHGKIRVGYLDNYLPFCESTMTGELTGMLKDYLALAATCTRNAKLDFETRSYSNLRNALDALKNGEIDCVFPVHLSAHDAEELGVIVTTPFVESEMNALISTSNQNLFSEGKEITIAVNETNANYRTFLRNNYPNAKVLNRNTLGDCLSAVESNLADCVIISNYRVSPSILNEYNLYSLATGKSMDFGFAVRRSDHELYYTLNKTASLVPAAAIHSLLTSYSYSGIKFSFSDFLRSHVELVIVAAILFAMLAILFITRRAKRAEQELRDKIAIQNQKMEGQRKIDEVDSIISSVASDYRSIYYVDLVRDEGLCYRAKTNSSNKTSDLANVNKGDRFSFREKMVEYANTYIVESDREKFLKFIEPDNIRAKLANEIMTAHRYLTIRDGVKQYEMLRIVDVHLVKERDKHTVNAISVGFADVDSETRELLEQNRALTDALQKAGLKTV